MCSFSLVVILLQHWVKLLVLIMWFFFPRGATVSEISGKKAPQKIPSYPMGGFSDTHTQTYTVAHRPQKQTHTHKHTHRCTHRGRHTQRHMLRLTGTIHLCKRVSWRPGRVCELSRPWKSSKQKKLSFSHLEASKISQSPPIGHTLIKPTWKREDRQDGRGSVPSAE